MTQYRIKQGEGYDGCIPITVYWVQMSTGENFWGETKWKNIKGFDEYDRAKQLLKTLQ